MVKTYLLSNHFNCFKTIPGDNHVLLTVEQCGRPKLQVNQSEPPSVIVFSPT